jgi:transcriptional regulator with PAS, ATPase and Fis domain
MKKTVSELEQDIKQAWADGDMSGFKQMSEDLLELAEHSELQEVQASAHNFQGLYHNRFSNFDKALEHFFAAMQLYVSSTDAKTRSTLYTNIGMTYGSMRNLEKSLEYYLLAYELNPESCELNLNLGFAHKEMHKFEKALGYYDTAYQLARRIDDKKLQSWSLLHTATVLSLQGEIIESNRRLSMAMKIAAEIGDEYQIGGIMYQQAINQKQTGHYDKAVSLLNEILIRNIKADNVSVIRSVYAELADAYYLAGDLQNAYQFKSKQLELSETVFNNQISDRINLLQKSHKLELEKLEKQQEQIRKEIHLKDLRLAEFKKAYSNVTGIGQVGIFSTKMKEIVKMADFFHKDRNVPVLIEGATGTGKEIIARIIHYGNEELKNPFITLNCSAISESLFESELFGYETGAFTGAKAAGMIGKMELAQGGTLFLDEIGELPLSMQPKLLRALQQKEIFRIGGNTCVKLNIRIICATNRNLALELEKGNFREDLYYRLNTGKITIPPLSERKEEIAPLAQVFLMEFAKEKKKSFLSIENEAIKLLESYTWPGNVRELRNVIERTALLYDDLELRAEHLDFLNQRKSPEQSSRMISISIPEAGIDYSEIERRIFQKGLELCDGNKTQLAKLLNISVKTIYRRKL